MRVLPIFVPVLAVALLCAPLAQAATDVRVDDAIAADRAASAAMSGDFDRAAATVTKICRADLRDDANIRIAVLAARQGKVDLARRLADRIGNAGTRHDATMEMAIVAARQGRLAAAERAAATLTPERRQQVRAVIAAVLAARGSLREALQTTRRTNDLDRRRDNMVTLRGGFVRGLSLRAAIGTALGAENKDARVRSLVTVAWSLVRQGRSADGLVALSEVYKELQTGISDSRLNRQTAADRAMILVAAHDFIGAQQAAEEIDDSGLRDYLLRHIHESRNFADK